MPNRARVLDLDHPLGQFADRLRRLQREAIARASCVEDVTRLQVEKVAHESSIGKATIYAALSGRRLASPQTVVALVHAWDLRGARGLSEWLDLRNEIESQLAQLASVQPPEANASGGATQSEENSAASSGESVAAPAKRSGRRGDDPTARFGQHLRMLWHGAGRPSYRDLSQRTGLSVATCVNAIEGNSLPRWSTIERFLLGIGSGEDVVYRTQIMWKVAADQNKYKGPRRRETNSMNSRLDLLAGNLDT